MFHWIQLWWDTWNLRAIILFSLFLQTFLFFSAPLRRRTANSLVTVPIWLAYNLADATAIFGMGLISKPCGDTLGPYANPELVAFWAPFLLLHLGGPDTITAFAPEDNELWRRHLLQLVVQLATSAYVFILTLSSNNQLWLPTLLIFISALIKSVERTRSLYLASWRRFRDSKIREPNPGPNYHRLMDEYFSNQESDLSSHPGIVEATVGDNNMLIPDIDDAENPWLNLLGVTSHHFLKGLITEIQFSAHERDRSRSYFLKLTPEQAFVSVTIELNILYELLFTKIPLLHPGSYWFNSSRFVSFVSCLAAFLLFHSIDPKHKFLHHKIDVEITYALLLGTIVHDVIAFIVINASDSSMMTRSLHHYSSNPILLSYRLISLISQIIGFIMKIVSFELIPIMNRRWSGCIPQYNLIFYCLHPRSKTWDKLIGNLGLTNILDGMTYVKTKRFNELLSEFIFDELKVKSIEAGDVAVAKKFCSAKGDWVLRHEGGFDNLLPYTLDADYDKILILWHIATELCYNTEEGNSDNQKFREISKVLSDYMLYLLIMEPTIMPAAIAGIAQMRFRDTCAEAKLFFQDRGVLEKVKIDSCLEACLNCTTQRNEYRRRSSLFNSGHKPDMIQACESILDVHTVVNPSNVKGDTSKTVLFDACILAKELKNSDKDKWKILSKVWVELLAYAASHCNTNSHATHLSKGLQLISLVWLLMAHMGLGDHFQHN